MVQVHVNEAIAKLKSAASNLDKDKIVRASVNAINRTLVKGRTLARKEVKGQYNIPQKNLDGINKKNASSRLMIGYIIASAKPIPMDAFAPKFETPKSKISISRKGVMRERDFARKRKSSAKGVSIEVVKGQRKTVDYAFMIKGAKPRVFARGQYKGGTSYGFTKRNKRVNAKGSDTPIKPLISVTVHGAVINEKVEKNIGNEMSSFFSKRLEHEINYQINKIKT